MNEDTITLKIGCFSIIGLPLLALLILAWGWHAYNRAKWDGVVDDLCKKNGGLVVYKKPKIPKEEYDYYLKWGVPDKSNPIPKYGVPAYPGKYYEDAEPSQPIYVKGNPYEWGISVAEYSAVIKNRDTEEVTARNTEYRRVGGYLIPSFSHGPKQHGCGQPISPFGDISTLFREE